MKLKSNMNYLEPIFNNVQKYIDKKSVSKKTLLLFFKKLSTSVKLYFFSAKSIVIGQPKYPSDPRIMIFISFSQLIFYR